MTREEFRQRAIIAALPEAGMQKRSQGAGAIAVTAIEIADAATDAVFEGATVVAPERPVTQTMTRAKAPVRKRKDLK